MIVACEFVEVTATTTDHSGKKVKRRGPDLSPDRGGDNGNLHPLHRPQVDTDHWLRQAEA
jgi:hypothetical protein